ncbi:hypothetical protein BpHYR1_020651 [Brachionus plicatilis]|uniref:Uncharacterized protein n=1 Tax=Brachionus plicatilis TaxID=10195 RepID=A0A3M7QBW6_BRAPC|nr:hypothetical protein BpHYR1_020651 [Brachionus plicatilis]
MVRQIINSFKLQAGAANRNSEQSPGLGNRGLGQRSLGQSPVTSLKSSQFNPDNMNFLPFQIKY